MTNAATQAVRGSAEPASTVTLYRNGDVASDPLPAGDNGGFTGSVDLVEGENTLTAHAANRGGESAASAAVLVTRDASVPDTPAGLLAEAGEAGSITLSWNAVPGGELAGYDVYRATGPFDDISAAERLTPASIAASHYEDLPPVEGSYTYRVVALNTLGTASEPSNPATATADATAPRAVEIAYAPEGNVDPASGRTAPGRVDVALTVSEPLLTTPFLSIVPDGGVPVTIALDASGETMYEGTFEITEATPGGTAYAVFSARDTVGNRGTIVDEGETLLIDADGPALTALDVVPDSPVRNDETDPVTLQATFTLDEPAAQTPAFGYLLSGEGRSGIGIADLATTDFLTWQAAFTLPADAGLADDERLDFTLETVDGLGNVNTHVPANTAVQVYQGQLPALETPTGLTAVAVPGGRIELTWDAVDGAAAYQLYRRAALEPEPSVLARMDGTSTTDAPGIDGEYYYAVASVRQDNGEESLSPLSAEVAVTADASAPPAPRDLALELTPQGIHAGWLPPEGIAEAVTYRLYRSSETVITSVDGLTPILEDIDGTEVLDTHPSEQAHTYAVTAVDAAGNESAPSASAYLNFDLLPVSSLDVTQVDDERPVLSWTHGGSTIAGFDVYLENGEGTLKLNDELMTATSYTDSGFDGSARRYQVVAVDHQGVESLARSIMLPDVSAERLDEAPVKRGLMNTLDYRLTNDGDTLLADLTLRVAIEGRDHHVDNLDLPGQSELDTAVVVGGYADLPAIGERVTTIEHNPAPGERIRIVRHGQVDVVDGGLVMTLTPGELTRGASGDVRFTIENLSSVETEIVTAENAGNKASNEVRLKLLDGDGNVLAVQGIRQALGEGVVTLANRRTVARIPAGGAFTSAPVTLDVPLAASDTVTVKLEVDHVHYHLGRSDQVTLGGRSTTADVALLDTLYRGEIDDVTPAVSFGEEDIVVSGRAVQRSTGAPLARVPLTLVLTLNGFERTYTVSSDADGAFTWRFTPTTGESGTYQVAAIHPDLTARPVHASFTIQRVKVSPRHVNLSVPRNYEQTVNITVSSSVGDNLTNLRLVHDPADQPGGVHAEGVHVTLPDAQAVLSAGGTAKLPITLWADNSAADTGELVFEVVTDERSLSTVTIHTAFAAAQPALNYSPGFIELGVTQDGVAGGAITVKNNGLAPLESPSVQLLDADGLLAAPAWIQLLSAASPGDLAVGEGTTIDLAAAPHDSVSEGIYEFTLRLNAANHVPVDIGVFVSVVNDAIGSVLFHAADIYTATLDDDGAPIHGLAGARIHLQNEAVISIEYTGTTDGNGEWLLQDIPAGSYRYRASAPNHQDQSGRVIVQSGLTGYQRLFLDYNLVTVEWSVNEITIEDEYQITITATYETDVPAAVVVAEPQNVSLPKMAPGDVFYGEFRLTNHGLVRADNIRTHLPESDAYFEYEFLIEVPDALDAKDSLTVPYRVVSLQPLDPDATQSGGGCGTYQEEVLVQYDYTCAAGDITDNATRHRFTRVWGSCTSPPRPPQSTDTTDINYGGASGGGGSSNPGYQPLPSGESSGCDGSGSCGGCCRILPGRGPGGRLGNK